MCDYVIFWFPIETESVGPRREHKFLRQAVVHQNAKPVRESRKISISFEHLFMT